MAVYWEARSLEQPRDNEQLFIQVIVRTYDKGHGYGGKIVTVFLPGH
jgi:hypothetical protein